MVAAGFDPVRNVVEADQPLLDSIDDERASGSLVGKTAGRRVHDGPGSARDSERAARDDPFVQQIAARHPDPSDGPRCPMRRHEDLDWWTHHTSGHPMDRRRCHPREPARRDRRTAAPPPAAGPRTAGRARGGPPEEAPCASRRPSAQRICATVTPPSSSCLRVATPDCRATSSASSAGNVMPPVSAGSCRQWVCELRACGPWDDQARPCGTATPGRRAGPPDSSAPRGSAARSAASQRGS